MTENSNFLKQCAKNTFLVKPYRDGRCDISVSQKSDACQKKPHLMGLLSINCCLLVKLYITLEQKFFKTDECCIKTCFYCGIINIF